MAKGFDIRRRIKSIKSTKSITKAMEMVAASKMKKAQDQAIKTRSYSEKALAILARISGRLEGRYPHFLLDKKEGNNLLVLLITSNKGLCGSLNGNVIKKTLDFVKKQRELNPEVTFDFVTLGTKGRDAIIRLGYNVIADFSDLGDTLSFLDIAPLCKVLLDNFKNKKYQRVYIIYTYFISVLNQKSIVNRLVPLGKDIMDSMKEVMQKQVEAEAPDSSYEYLFEPSPHEVLDELLPKLVDMQVYQSILEANASEQSSRMMAMKNATEAASDLIDDLTLLFNKTRQASITQEIAEIVGGVEGLKTFSGVK